MYNDEHEMNLAYEAYLEDIYELYTDDSAEEESWNDRADREYDNYCGERLMYEVE